MTVARAEARLKGEPVPARSKPVIPHFMRVAMGEEEYEKEMLRIYAAYWTEKAEQEKGEGA